MTAGEPEHGEPSLPEQQLPEQQLPGTPSAGPELSRAIRAEPGSSAAGSCRLQRLPACRRLLREAWHATQPLKGVSVPQWLPGGEVE